MNALKIIEKVVSEKLGEPIEVIRNRTWCEHRRMIEKKHGAPMTAITDKPQYFLSHAAVEKIFDDCLKK